MFDELVKTSQLALEDIDTYLSFDENRLGRAAVTRLNPTARSTMTLLYGSHGVGKTHLALWAISQLKNRYPRLKFSCTSAELLAAMIEHSENDQSLAELFERFRSLQILICEDLQQLELQPEAQRRLQLLIDSLEQGSTQILFTSRKAPGEIRSLDQKLVSRIHGGLCVRITQPGLESRVQLFQTWFRELRLPILKPFVASAQFLAERMPLSVFELRLAVMALAREQRKEPCPIDTAYLERWIRTVDRTPRLSLDTIIKQVAKEFSVDSSQILSRSRQQGLAIPRQCAMWLARELTGRPLETIGDFFGRSHTTVSHSLARLKDQIPKNPSLRQHVQKLRQQLEELPREECA